MRKSLSVADHGVGNSHGGHQQTVQECGCPDVTGLLIQVTGNDGGDGQGGDHGDHHDAGQSGAIPVSNAGGEQGDVLDSQPDDGAAGVQNDGQSVALPALQLLGVGVDGA